MKQASRAKALITAVLAAILGLAAYLFGVQNATGQLAENTALGASEFTTQPAGPLGMVNPTSILVSGGIVVLIALLSWGIGRAVVIAGATAISLVASQILKSAVLERPDIWEISAVNTFPSGHATVFAALGFGLILALPGAARGFMSVIIAVSVALINWQILAAGWHRPSDVIGALALVLASYGVMAALIPATARRGKVQLRNTPSRVILNVLAVITLVISLGCGIYAWAANNASVLLTAGGYLCAAIAFWVFRRTYTLIDV